MTVFARLFSFAVLSLLAVVPAASQQKTLDLENFLILDLPTGKVGIMLRPDLAPQNVERVKRLVREGFYDGSPFHRVLEGFMAQTGTSKEGGERGSKYPNLKAEFSKEPFQRGTVGAARTNDPHSANSQFFICLEAAPWLNGQYTVWGTVVGGMEHVDKIKKGVPGSGQVTDPDRIVRLQVATDADDTTVLDARNVPKAK